MSAPLPQEFYLRPTLQVTRELLGKTLCRRIGDDVIRLPLTELEAYDGPEDRACHAHKGQTPRNRIMFGPGGHWYVYLCYGIHWMLNVVTGPPGFPAAVLVRGVGSIFGPGRVTKHLQIDKLQHEHPVCPSTGLWIEDAHIVVPDAEVTFGPRVGVDYAGEEWAAKEYRFVWEVQRSKGLKA